MMRGVDGGVLGREGYALMGHKIERYILVGCLL